MTSFSPRAIGLLMCVGVPRVYCAHTIPIPFVGRGWWLA